MVNYGCLSMFKNDLYDMQLVDFDSLYQVFTQFFRIIVGNGIICLVFLGWENWTYSKITQEHLARKIFFFKKKILCFVVDITLGQCIGSCDPPKSER